MAGVVIRNAGRPGDVIVIHGHHLREPERIGEILEVIGEPGHERYRVHWDDEYESIFYPGSDATIEPASRRRRAAP